MALDDTIELGANYNCNEEEDRSVRNTIVDEKGRRRLLAVLAVRHGVVALWRCGARRQSRSQATYEARSSLRTLQRGDVESKTDRCRPDDDTYTTTRRPDIDSRSTNW